MKYEKKVLKKINNFHRQVWMYSTLYQNVERFKKKNIYEAAVRGGDFLRKFGKNKETGKCYFAVTREGRPIKVQRTIYSEVAQCKLIMSSSTETLDE